MRFFKTLAAASSLLLAVLPYAGHAADERPIAQIRWRALGPALPEGRASAIVGSDAHPLVYYAGFADGGIWKSIDAGTSWQQISDSAKLTSVGAIALDPKDDSVVWAGAGETNPRNDIIQQRGLYKSTNGGRAWSEITSFSGGPGVSKILVDPADSKHVIVGVLGDVFAPSADRGAYVTFDGGTTWTKSLYVADQSGVSDMAMDPKNPQIVYAGLWHALRRPWAMTSGGKDDGLYRSADGGKTWTHLQGNGLPSGPLGRIGLAIAPSDSKRIYALIESHDGVLWRSDDAGATWKMVSKDTSADQRPFYFSHIRVSPTAENTVYGVSMFLATSFNGGGKFDISAFGVHSDLHDMWIAADGQRMGLAGDGGISLSHDGGSTWANSRNINASQVYRVAASDTIPYFVCGGLQDNNGYCGPAFSGDMDGISNSDWFKPVEGDGEWVVPDPLDNRLVWADSENGEVQVYNRFSHDAPNVRPYRGELANDFVLGNAKYRFNWQSPIAFAAYDPHLAFVGGNVVFATRDRGAHWTAISPDLTHNDKSKQQGSKDSVTQDESGAENYATLLDIESSALHKGEIWTGSDDGVVSLTLDGGKHWRTVTPADLPQDSAVESIAPSTLKDGTAYMSADRHAMGDTKPYLYVTHDFGAHWQKIVSGFADGEFVRAVRPDIVNPSMVYAGTNMGIRVSCDGGSTWQSFQSNLPQVEVRDIRFQPRFDDMIIATHGRGIWILDDMRIVQHAGCTKPTSPLVIGPRTVYAITPYRNDEGHYTDFIASQPGAGLLTGGTVAPLYYWLPTEAKKRPTIDVYDAKGHRVRHIEGEHAVFTGTEGTSHWISNASGKNLFAYDLTIDGPAQYNTAKFFFKGPDEGPQLPPGHYTIAFNMDGKTYRFPIDFKADPSTSTTQAEFERAFEQRRKEYDLLDRTDIMLNELARVKKTLQAAKPVDSKAVGEIDALVASLTSSPENFEDFILKPGQFREDVMGLIQQEPLAQASLTLYATLERRYVDKARLYNAWAARNKAAIAPLAPRTLAPIASR